MERISSYKFRGLIPKDSSFVRNLGERRKRDQNCRRDVADAKTTLPTQTMSAAKKSGTSVGHLDSDT
jgi:hypothetical protein